MISRNITTASRLREIFLNGRWIAGTNYKEQLQSVNWQQAIHKVDNLNTIAALTYHINYYLQGLLHAFETSKLEISDQYSFNLDSINSESDWEKLVATFLSHAEKFVIAVEGMDETTFDQAFLDNKYGTLQRNLEGVIEHGYYHLGQIVLIRKIIHQNGG